MCWYKRVPQNVDFGNIEMAEPKFVDLSALVAHR